MKFFNRYKGKWKRVLSFAIVYAILVLCLTIVFRFFPSALALENQFFDRIQKKSVIDSKSDFLYKRYAHALDDLFLINLDSTFFDFESNRIKKSKLIKLFERLTPAALKADVIFLDYSYSYKSVEDSLLNESIKPIQEKLFFPFNFELKKELSIKGENSSLVKEDVFAIRKPEYEFENIGYAVPFEDPHTNTNRYFKYIFDDGSHQSVPYGMYKASKYSKENELNLDPVKVNEIQFILRNNDLQGEEKAVLVYDGKDILGDKMPQKYLETNVSEKVIVIGLFDDYKTKYLNPIDKFITPVDSQMSGALLMTNAFLNLSANISFKQDSWLLLFLINFFVAIVLALNYEKNISSKYVSIIALIFNLFISILLFYYVSYFFYIFLHIKLALGMSLLIYQKKYYLYSWYQHWWKGRFEISPK